MTPFSLNFGDQQVGTSSSSQKLTLQNTGSGPLYLSSIALTGSNIGDFSQINTCPMSPNSLAVYASCYVTVTFSPLASGTRSANVSIADNTLVGSHTVALKGNGTNFTVTLVPNTATFANQVVGTKSSAKSVTLTNKGTTSLTISVISVSGPNVADFSQTNTCGSSVKPSATCTISVTFTPLASGARSATLQVFDNGYQSPQTVSITGTGVQTGLSLTPASLTYSMQQVNTSSKVQRVTLSNTGAGALTINSITMSGANLADFSQTNTCPFAPGTLGIGKSCTISVTFTPKSSGSRSATLSINDDAPGSPHAVNLSGTGTAVSLSPATLNFYSVIVGRKSAVKTVTLTNWGKTSLTINSLAITGSNPFDFTQTNTCGTALAAGASCSVSVVFAPLAKGTRTASLTITDSDPASPQSVSLSGTGI